MKFLIIYQIILINIIINFLHFFEKSEILKIENDINNAEKKPSKDGIIIGILTMDTSDYNKSFPNSKYNMIAASYVKWIEQMGARVLPINYTSDIKTILSTIEKINGILLMGGSANLFEKYNN